VNEPLRFLDVGCGDGKKTVLIPEALHRRGEPLVRPVGIEVSKVQAMEAQERFATYGGECIKAPALEGMAQIGDGTINLIVLLSFLEHEMQPVELLRACAAKLAPGGRIIIKVPNFACWNRRVRQAKWCGFRYPDHVNYFTPATLESALQRAGLQRRPRGWLDQMPTSDNMWMIAEVAVSR
jgi:2-polyprenyl-3-methyl-5-hydroxy-6-metoxy-1,4-benzoquinol methylase